MGRTCRRFATTLAAVAAVPMLAFGAGSAAQTGGQLFASACGGCHDDVNHPRGLVYNAAGNVAVIQAVIARGMPVSASLAGRIRGTRSSPPGSPTTPPARAGGSWSRSTRPAPTLTAVTSTRWRARASIRSIRRAFRRPRSGPRCSRSPTATTRRSTARCSSPGWLRPCTSRSRSPARSSPRLARLSLTAYRRPPSGQRVRPDVARPRERVATLGLAHRGREAA